MADIAPFRGSRYATTRVALDDVVAPPYDVLGDDEVRALRARSPYNALHVDLPGGAGEAGGGEASTGAGAASAGETGASGDRYARAAATLRRWHDDGFLVRDEVPALYLLEQAYRGPDGYERLRRGVVARLRLAPFSEGIVLPHEKTHDGPKADRLALMRATHAATSQVFMLYPDDDGAVTAALAAAADTAFGDPAAAQTARDRDGNAHRIAPVRGAPAARVCELLRDCRLFIADGHHRYETAVHYRDERRAAGDAGADWLMVYLCSMRDPGLTVFPTHRLLKGVEIPPMDAVLARLREHFAVFAERATDAAGFESLAAHLRSFADPGKVFGLCFPRENACCTIELRDLSSVSHLLHEGFSTASAHLAVTVLHYLVFRDVLGLDPTATEGKIDYVTSPGEAFRRLQSGAYALGALINATQVDEVRVVAEAGETMPQKSTYFYPKLLTGLVYDTFGPA
jgi:uncharacterized protein (DUF1015 family)